ncbi:hypothetical protein OfM1_11400 [Lactovum odontotermitis]
MELVHKTSHYDAQNTKFYRALLGLADNYNENKMPVEGVERDPDDKNLAFNKRKPKIQRFQHPILFKPVKGEILILFNDLPSEMYNQEFTIGEKHIFTPKKEDFNLAIFFESFVKAKYENKILAIGRTEENIKSFKANNLRNKI